MKVLLPLTNYPLMRRWIAGFLFCLVAGLSQAEIVERDWLIQAFAESSSLNTLTIVDLRDSADFSQEHIQGSVHLNREKLFAEGYRMPSLDDLRELLSGLGIDQEQRVLVVDGGDFIWAARLYWLLETLGHDQVYFLDTAYGPWIKQLLPVSDEAIQPPRREFVPSVDSRRLQTQLGTLAAIDRHPILDGRAPEHYFGKASLASRFGHIPTAKNYPCTQNYEVTTSGARLRNLEVMAEVYSELPKDQPITLYCDGGAEAALNYVVLQALGYQVQVYEGSWLEWGNNPALPKVNPSSTQVKPNGHDVKD